jgi:hypothetical protein
MDDATNVCFLWSTEFHSPPYTTLPTLIVPVGVRIKKYAPVARSPSRRTCHGRMNQAAESLATVQ